MVTGTINAPAAGFGFPDAAAGALARAKAENAAGGVGGRQIHVTVCNDQAVVQDAVKCAEQAIANHDAAVLTGFSPFSAQVVQVLQQGGVPYVASDSPALDTTDTSAVSYPLSGNYPLDGVESAAIAQKLNCKTVGMLTVQDAAANDAIAEEKAAATFYGLKFAAATLPITQADPTASLQTLLSDGMHCIFFDVATPQSIAVIKEMHTIAPKVVLMAGEQNFPTATLQNLGPLANGLYLMSPMYPLDYDGTQAMREFGKEWEQYGAAASKGFQTQNALLTWTGMQLLIDAAGRIKGDVTPSAMRSALNGVSGLTLSTFPGTYAAGGSSVPKFSRIANFTRPIEVARDGKVDYKGSVNLQTATAAVFAHS
jgi:ABC-type branched-subunit amino acid transport system substrate-binding protein